MFFSGIEKFSLVDFEGKICCTLFTQGCNYRCPFCHNSALVVGGAQRRISFLEVLDFLKKRKGILDAVSITGGEPTLHPELEDFLKEVKELGFLTKLDTNGTNPAFLKKLNDTGAVDYFAMDIKTSLERYPTMTGVRDAGIDKVKESIAFLISDARDYEFRTTLVNEFHSEEIFTQIAHTVKGAKRYFLQEFEDRGTNIEGGLSAVPKETALIYADILSGAVGRVALRGYL